MRLSQTMREALACAAEHEELQRWEGGFWTYPGCPHEMKSLPEPTKVPSTYFGALTINALMDRGLLKPIRRHALRGFLVAVEITPEGRAELSP